MTLYGITVFLSAFLLFLVQPLIGKYILPWFGGTPAVWTTCMLFFQVLLLAGYSYAHLIATRLKAHRQAQLHLALLAVTILALPIAPSEAWKPLGGSPPLWRILGLLTASVGIPYFLLSSMGPLLQSWFSRLRPQDSPYRLYALSNAGSLLAILSYPFLVEPTLGLTLQSHLWSYSYLGFALSSAWVAIQLFRAANPESPAPLRETGGEGESAESSPAAAERVLWVLLPAFGSIMLLATTNQMCQDVAVIPLLWIVPLSLYLLSFILCFHSEKWYSRTWFGIALATAAGISCTVLHKGVFVDLRVQLASYSLALFVFCMVCHGELVRLKPGPKHLTSFYLAIAAGGAIGGILVTMVAPLVFKGYWELHAGLAGTCLLFLIILFRDRQGALYRGQPLWAWAVMYVGLAALVAALGVQIRESLEENVEMTRSFFGVLRVLEQDKDNPPEHRYTLMHGRIEHGFQMVDPEKRYWPTSYFGPNSGAGVAIRFHPRRRGNSDEARNLRIGVVGLGTGTLASYGEAGDYVEFYEINPEVLRLSDKYFTYRKSSPASIDVLLGDARISMERERARNYSRQFDVLAVDAFAGDAVPVHLLTRECYSAYEYHLKEDGILAIHVSNRYFNLTPVVRGFAELDPEKRMQALWVDTPGNPNQETDSSDWVLLTRNQQFIDSPEVRNSVRQWADIDPPPVLWTDDYTNLFGLLRK